MDTTATLRNPNPRDAKRVVSALVLALGLAAIIVVAVISTGDSSPAGADTRGPAMDNVQPVLVQPVIAPIPAPPDALDGPSAPLPVHSSGVQPPVRSYHEQKFLEMNLYLPGVAPVVETLSPFLEENRWGEDFKFESGSPFPAAGPYTKGPY
jgi:hypothetical protein